ncbi:DUF438 domain-containing protein [Candidatus Latescibacterota bacterium]
MKISPDTSVNELLKTYPHLVDFLVAYNPKFKMLKNKLMRVTVGNMATLKQVAGIGGVPLDILISDIAAEIDCHSCIGGESSTEKAEDSSVNKEKVALMKNIILDYHNGMPFNEMKKRFDELIDGIAPTEIVAMEEQLIRDGMPIEKVQKLSELHIGAFRDALDENEVPETPSGHPVHTFIEENKTLTTVAGDMDLLLEQLRVEGTSEILTELEKPLEKALEMFSRVDIHYQRKENQLFPYLEKHDFNGPPQVMWGVHDDIRAQLKQYEIGIVRTWVCENQVLPSPIFTPDDIG